MKHINDILKYVMTTEKSTAMQEKENRYMLRVDIKANKSEIKRAVEEFFNVTVVAVNTQIQKEKSRVLRNRRTVTGKIWKRAIVTLKKGDKIDML